MERPLRPIQIHYQGLRRPPFLLCGRMGPEGQKSLWRRSGMGLPEKTTRLRMRRMDLVQETILWHKCTMMWMKDLPNSWSG